MRRSRGYLLAALLLPCLVPRVHPQSALSLEYQVKAAYLLNFTRYVEWPPARTPAADRPLTLCILGKDPFGDALDQALRDRTSQGHRIVLRRVQTARMTDGCHVVFLTDDTWSGEAHIVATLTSRGILTVGNSDRFAKSGGVIGFIISNETVRFVINLHARDEAGLRISSRMLSLATTLYSTEGPRF